MAWRNPFWDTSGGASGRDYGAEKRNSKYIRESYGRILWATGAGVSTIFTHTNIPSTPFQRKNVNDRQKDKGDGTDDLQALPEQGLYEFAGRGKTNPDGDPKYLPKAIIVSISTSAIPDSWGSVWKGSVTVKTFSSAQAAGFSGLTTLGVSNVGASWGWSYPSAQAALDETVKGAGGGFSGVVIGYSASLNSEGGWDITITGLQANAALGATSMAAMVKSASGSATDAAGNQYVITSVISAMCAATVAAIEAKTPGPITVGGLSGHAAEIPSNYSEEETEPSGGDEGKPKMIGYILVRSIVEKLSAALRAATGAELLFAPDQDYGYNTSGMLAGNPLEVLVGGSDYGGKAKYGSPAGSPSANLKIGDLWICAEWAKNALGNYTAAVAQNPNQHMSIGDFMNKIFTVCSDNLGKWGSFALCCSADPGDKNLYICEVTKATGNPGTPSRMRSATISAQADDNVITAYKAKQSFPDESGAGSTGPGTIDTGDYAAAVAAVGAKASESNTRALKDLNVGKVSEGRSAAGSWGFGAPINFSFSVDGEGGGLRIGQVVSAPLVSKTGPNGTKLGFVITSVNHSVSGGDWTVSYETVGKFVKN